MNVRIGNWLYSNLLENINRTQNPEISEATLQVPERPARIYRNIEGSMKIYLDNGNLRESERKKWI